MRLMIIGASGFLGAHVRRRALAAGAEVVTAGRSELADSPATGSSTSPKRIQPGSRQ